MEYDIVVPQTIRRCNDCSFTIFDDEEHLCRVRTACFRMNVYAKMPWKVFSFQLRGDLQLLTNGHFQAIGNFTYMSAATEGLFTFEKTQDLTIVSYEATALTRLSIIFAIEIGDLTETVFRAELCPAHGIKFVDLRAMLPSIDDKIVLPSRYNLNTVLVLRVMHRCNVDFMVYTQPECIQTSYVMDIDESRLDGDGDGDSDDATNSEEYNASNEQNQVMDILVL